MASSSRPSRRPSAIGTPTATPSSPRPSESFFSEADGTAPSILDTSADFHWDGQGSSTVPQGLDLVSWRRRGEDEESEFGLPKVVDDLPSRGFYAISTVIAHPTKKANPLRSTRKPLPPLGPPPALPKPPPPSHYDAYLREITPLYENVLNAQLPSGSSTSGLTGAFDNISKEPAASLPSLDGIPDVFFDASFNLADPATWLTVTRGTSSSADEPLPADRIQDDLSSHLDNLERHLIHEITLRSTSFFSALSNLQDLHSESASCLARIRELQAGLKEIGENTAQRGLKVIDKHEELRVLRVTEDGLEGVKALEGILEVTKTFVDAEDWRGGLGCLGEIQEWWNRHQPGDAHDGESRTLDATAPDEYEVAGMRFESLPLATLPALDALPQLFSDIRTQIALHLETALHSYLLTALSAAELDVPYDKDRVEEHIAPMIEGLGRCGVLDGIESLWRDVVTLAVREGSRKHLPISQAEEEAEEAGQEPKGASLAQSLRSMDHRSYLALSIDMYRTMLLRLRFASTLGTDLLSLCQSCKVEQLDLQPPVSPIGIVVTSDANTADHPSAVSIDVTEILASACDLANLRASKILGVRGEQHAGLKIEEFVEVYKANWDFILKSEELSGRAIPSLRGVLAAQARTFLIAYHSHRLTRSAKLVEEEQWSQIDVSARMRHAVALLIEGATDDPAECFVPPRQVTDSSDQNGHAGTIDEGPTKTLDVEGTPFFVVKATAESLELLSEYLRVVINLEVVVTDVMARIIEFLKSFNSRTCQVVLGAGAMRSAGLKNITAKHLALASQSLSIVVALIPYIREFIRRHLTPKQAVMLTEFDKLKRDYQEHQNEIHAKLVAIMSDRLAVHCGSLREIDWEATPDKDAPRAYAEMLVKETTTLHKVLSKYLSSGTVEAVMSQVLAAVFHRLSEEYSRIELKSEDSKKRMTQDVSLIASKLQNLSESGATLSGLETLVKDKPIPRKTVLGGFFKGKKGTAVEGEKVQSEGGMVEEQDMGDEEEEDKGEVAEPREGESVQDEDAVEVKADDAQEGLLSSRGAAPSETSGVQGIVDPQPGLAPPLPVKTSIDEPKTDKTVNDPLDPDRTASPPPPPPKQVPSPSPTAPTLATPQPTRLIGSSLIETAVPAGTSTAISINTALPLSPKSTSSTPLPDSNITVSPSRPEARAQSPVTVPSLPATTSPAGTGSPLSRASFSTFAASLRSPPPAHPQSPLQAGSPFGTPTPTTTAATNFASGANASPQQATPTRAPRVSLANRLKGVMTRSGSADNAPTILEPPAGAGAGPKPEPGPGPKPGADPTAATSSLPLTQMRSSEEEVAVAHDKSLDSTGSSNNIASGGPSDLEPTSGTTMQGEDKEQDMEKEKEKEKDLPGIHGDLATGSGVSGRPVANTISSADGETAKVDAAAASSPDAASDARPDIEQSGVDTVSLNAVNTSAENASAKEPTNGEIKSTADATAPTSPTAERRDPDKDAPTPESAVDASQTEAVPQNEGKGSGGGDDHDEAGSEDDEKNGEADGEDAEQVVQEETTPMPSGQTTPKAKNKKKKKKGKK